MKNVTRSFAPGDRYTYDFGKCSASKGYAQVDTGQDASYYGTWANPTTFTTVCYCEGDVTVVQLDTPAEFHMELMEVKIWNEEEGYGFRGIDPMGSTDIKEKFIALGLSELLY